MAGVAPPESSTTTEKEAKVNPHRESETAKGDASLTLPDASLTLPDASLTLPVEHQGILERYTQTSMFQMLSPLIFNMKMFGLYFVRHYPEESEKSVSDTRAESHRTRCPTPSQVYASVCVLLLWVYAVLCGLNLTTGDHYGSDLFIKILGVITSTFAGVNATVVYVAFHRADWLPELFIYWDRLHGDVSNDRIKYVRKRVLAAVVLLWMIILSSLAYTIYMIFFLAGSEPLFTFLSRDLIFNLVVKYMVLVESLLLFGAWMFPMFLMSGLFAGVYREFLKLNTDISKVIGDKRALESEIATHRLRHQNLCRLVDKADRCVSVLLANSFVMIVAIICLMLYMAVSVWDTVLGGSLRVYFGCWTVVSSLYLGISSIGAALVNSQVSLTLVPSSTIPGTHPMTWGGGAITEGLPFCGGPR